MFLNLLLFDVIILLFRDGNGVSAIHYLIRRVPTIIALPGILTSNCHHNVYSVTKFFTIFFILTSNCHHNDYSVTKFFFYNFHKRSAILLFEEARREKYTICLFLISESKIEWQWPGFQRWSSFLRHPEEISGSFWSFQPLREKGGGRLAKRGLLCDEKIILIW